jgi:hypothetical protein
MKNYKFNYFNELAELEWELAQYGNRDNCTNAEYDALTDKIWRIKNGYEKFIYRNPAYPNQQMRVKYKPYRI